MLFGEHAVLHGQPCIVTALDLRVYVSLERNESGLISIKTITSEGHKEVLSTPVAQLFSLKEFDPQARFVLAAIRRFFAKYKINQGLNVTTRGPARSYGLGTSSAVTVATLFGLFKLFVRPVLDKELFELAHGAVLDVQKVGSGFDVASAIYGGTLFFQPGRQVEPIHTNALPIIIGFSGAKVSTTDLIQVVEGMRMRQPAQTDQVFRSIGEIVRRARIGMQQKDWQIVGELANRNQSLLESLGVSVENLNSPILAAGQAGALGAKLSGAGGGDCMFAVVDDRSRQLVEQALQSSGAQVLDLQTNDQGVRVETESA